MLRLIIFTVIFVAVSVTAANKECPVIHGIFGCAYMPRCFGDSMCGPGHKCCTHPCGNRCMLIVNCEKIDCNLNCNYGLDQDAKGCDVCKCRTTKKCDSTDLLCLLGSQNLFNQG